MITHISTRHDFSSLYFYRKLHLFMNSSLTKLQRRVSFFSIRLVKSQKDKYKLQIQMQNCECEHFFLTSLDQVPKGILTNTELIAARVGPLLTWENCENLGESGNDLDTKTIWFGHKKYLSNREIRTPLHWYLIFREFTCFLESVIEKRIFVNIDEYLLII